MKRSVRYLAVELLALFHRDDDWYALNLPDQMMWAYYFFRRFRLFNVVGVLV